MSRTALETLVQLEWRLARVEFLLKGDSTVLPHHPTEDNHNGAPASTVRTRLAKLEERLADLRARVPAVDTLLKLREDNPQLFVPRPGDTQNLGVTEDDKLQIVLSSEETLSNTTSALHSLKENPLPDAQPLMAFVQLESRLETALQMLEQQAAEIEELRRRSATILAKWYQGSVLRDGENWADWETRLTSIEQAVLRKEKAQQRQQAEV